jgi:hypothetical protein
MPARCRSSLAALGHTRVGVFGLPDRDYMRFLAFLRHHSLKPDRG